MKLSIVLLVLTAPMFGAPNVADTIYCNGTVFTNLNWAITDGSFGQITVHSVSLLVVQGVSVAGDKILGTGPCEDLKKQAGPHTQMVDLRGAFVMPGFNDAHVHLWSGGLEAQRIDLVGAKSLDEMKSRIAEQMKHGGFKAGEWVLGRGWDHTLWPGQKLPSRQDLDAATGDHPAFFVRIDGHIGIANTAALKEWKITRTTPDPKGAIDHDAKGEPTGILREQMKEHYQTLIPKPSLEQRKRAVVNGLADAAQWGVTSIQESPVNPQDPSEWQFFLIYEDLEREGKLTARVSEWLPFDAPLELLQKHRAHHPHDDAMLHTAMLKGYLDGSLGSRTAAMLAPYSDDPKNTGIAYYDPAKLNAMAAERALAGFQLGFHAIGDRAMQMALDAFREADRQLREKKKSGATDGITKLRPRIEHDQVLTANQFKQMAELGVVASMQPNHLLTDMNWAVERIGEGRAKYSYAWRSMLDNKIPLAFGTDYPVEPITPFRGIYCAVTRKNEAGDKEYFPAEKLTIEQAIAAYTTGPAYAEFAEKEKGTLAPGMLADFVVLDRDITKVAPAEILHTKVLRTVVGGKTVYEAK